jgi:2-methylaconitate cis-trans-isomerase PrpF
MQRAITATFMRGGTSKALVFHRRDLPDDRAEWDQIFCDALGSPDPYGRQLDGMGGGLSSLSKVCIVEASSRDDADIDYTFGQVSVDAAAVDYSANCGNMSAAMGPFAVDEGLIEPVRVGDEAVVRIHNTNTGKIIVSRFALEGDRAAVDGEFAIDGVAGTAACIRLDFLDPGGAATGQLLPTGRARDTFEIPDYGTVEVSIVDASNARVFVAAEALGLTGTEAPDELERRPAVMAALESIRRQASVAMGITTSNEAAAEVPASPKVAIIAAPAETRALSGARIAAEDVDILVRMISMGRVHRAVPATGGLCLAVACRIPGSVANSLLSPVVGDGALRIGHPSGVLTVDAVVDLSTGAPVVSSATLYRTARRLFQGEVLVRFQSR